MGALIALATAGLAVVPTPASAANFTVTVATDGHGAGTLRWAFDQANASVGPDTITLGSGVTYDLTLPGGDDSNAGGDLDSNNGDLTIVGNGSTIRQTVAGQKVIDQNDNGTTIEIQNVTITGGNHDGGGDGGRIHSNGSIVVTDSTVTGNSAEGNGGGIYAYDNVTINNSTVTGNTAAESGGGFYLEAYELYGHYNTINSNTAFDGANISLGQGGTMALWGSVVSNPLGGGDNCDGWSTSASGGYNYEAATDTCGFDQATDTASGADPLLGAVAANGGPTQTMLPQSGSPLIDAIPTSNPDCSGDDQRGVIRPQEGGCEIGSVEVEPPPPPTTTTTAAPTTTTTAAASPQALTPTFTG